MDEDRAVTLAQNSLTSPRVGSSPGQSYSTIFIIPCTTASVV